MKNYIYLDKFGHITSGVGALLDDEKAFKSVPWKIGDRLATEAEVDAAYRYFVAKKIEMEDRDKWTKEQLEISGMLIDMEEWLLNHHW